MKKIMLFAAAALVGATFADGVASDVVGYNQITIHPGWNMFAVNYDGVSGTAGVPINDLLPKTGITAGSGSGSADTISVWKEDGSGDYDMYFLYYTTKAKFTSANYTWVESAGTTFNGNLADLGLGMYYYCRGNGFKLQMPRPYSAE